MLLLTLAITLTVVASAVAAEDGKGWIGEETDGIVTAFGLGLVAFIALLVTVLSLIQGSLEKRKDSKRRP